METEYTENFYKSLREGTERSAREVIPLVLELIQPRSVIDVGCGIGTWLSVFKEYGISDILGVDGDYIDRQLLEIPEEQFRPFDLKNPLNIERKFDLVVSLEVAEHLSSESAKIFVNSLTKLGPVILFSAAIPFQGGTGHINEQWPDYWVERFKELGYIAIDPIRKKVWQNKKVELWYAQNTLMFVGQSYLENYIALKNELKYTCSNQFSIVHPKLYLEIGEKYSKAFNAYTWYSDEAKAHKAKAEYYKAEADPKNMSLRKALKILSIVMLRVLRITRV